jgi:hypothetical protein
MIDRPVRAYRWPRHERPEAARRVQPRGDQVGEAGGALERTRYFKVT